MLGHIDAESASLWIRASKAADWSVEIDENPDFSSPKVVEGGAVRKNFDLFLMLGDNHYGDSTDLERPLAGVHRRSARQRK